MIWLGPAGNCGKSIMESLPRLKKLGLTTQEVQFVRGVHMSKKTASEAGALAKELGIRLSIHAPYYINLASSDPEKVKASQQRILDSCERGHDLGADHIVFHAGYYQGQDKKEVYALVKHAIRSVQEIVTQKGWKTILAPETSGKHSQFGDMEELLKLHHELKCGLCVDFAHLYARSMGKINFTQLFNSLHEFSHLHAHCSGIAYTEKGESHHLELEESFFKPIAQEIIQRNVDITIISESPITWKDSLTMARIIADAKEARTKSKKR
ncbi:TIM barrel protein [Candidatus Woesearchaeota archaeon]|nr:TIM barrel protein [Candidatus Woesearchaeota archaeon]